MSIHGKYRWGALSSIQKWALVYASLGILVFSLDIINCPSCYTLYHPCSQFVDNNLHFSIVWHTHTPARCKSSTVFFRFSEKEISLKNFKAFTSRLISVNSTIVLSPNTLIYNCTQITQVLLLPLEANNYNYQLAAYKYTSFMSHYFPFCVSRCLGLIRASCLVTFHEMKVFVEHKTSAYSKTVTFLT